MSYKGKVEAKAKAKAKAKLGKFYLQSSPLSSVTGLHLWAVTAALQLRKTVAAVAMVLV